MAKKKTSANGQGSKETQVVIHPINEQIAVFTVVGNAPYVQNKFTNKAAQQMRDKQLKGSQAIKNKPKREVKDFQQCFREAQHMVPNKNWPCGAIPATSFKAAMVAACRLIDFKMVDAKQCFYVLADGYGEEDRIPLVKITKGKPQYFEQPLPNANGNYDLRARPLWEPGWECVVRIRFDADRFSLQDIANLLSRAGAQAGIGAGRTSSRKCVGLGWGAFTIKSAKMLA